jgi:hypothetical protein
MPKREKRRRGEWAVLGFVLFASALIGGVYISAMRYYTDGGLSLPLDDPFIFFQYAKQASEGHPFSYNTGDAPTTGVTSLLYTLILIPGFWLGFSGLSIIYYSLFLSFLILIGTCFLIYLIGRKLVSPTVGVVSMLFVLLNGPFLWAVFSGMDTGLFGFTSVLCFWSFLSFYEKKRMLPVAIAGALLSITRPEGFIFSILLFSILSINQMTQPRNERLSISQFALSSIPLFTGVFWLLLNLILTGTINFNTMVAKSALTTGHSTVLDGVATGIRYSFFLLKEVFAGFSGDYIGVLNANSGYTAVYIAPFALFFFIITVFPQTAGEVRKKRLGAYTLILLWFFVGVLTTSATRPANDHWHRYIIPYYPLFLVMVAVGIHHMSQLLSFNQREAFWGVSSFFLLFGFLTAIYFAIAYGKNSKDIWLQQIAIGKWVKENIPEGSVIAINDAGAIKYLSQRYCIDLVGLCYPKIVKSSTHCGDGNGLIYEFLENLKRKPDYFIIYPSWFGFGSWVLGEEMASFGLFEPTMAGAGSDPMKIYKASFTGANSGDTIKLSSTKKKVSGRRLIDKIDIADIEDEARHSYKTWSAEPGLPKRTFATTASYSAEPEKIVTDGGRIISGGESFVIDTIPHKKLIIVARTTAPFSLGVYIDGQPRAWWRNTEGSQKTSLWYEPTISIPAQFITKEKTDIRIEVVDKHRVTYFVSYYWFYQ